MGLFRKSCYTAPTQPAPNPNPSHWTLITVDQYPHAHVLLVRYLDCTNFEGVKCVVFAGQFKRRATLDPHFSAGDDSPIARFRPDPQGISMARTLASAFKG